MREVETRSETIRISQSKYLASQAKLDRLPRLDPARDREDVAAVQEHQLAVLVGRRRPVGGLHAGALCRSRRRRKAANSLAGPVKLASNL